MTDTTDTTDTQTVTDPRPAFARAVDIAASVIGSVRPEHLELPTPCDQMDVGEMLSHLIMVAERVAGAGRGDDPASWTTEGPSLAVDEWPAAFRTAAAEAIAEWNADDARLERMTALPWTTVPGAAVVAIYTNELLVHTWDLSVAIGTDVDWDDSAIAVASAAIHEQLPNADRSPMWAQMAELLPEGIAWESPFGNAAEVADDASPIEHLAAWNGRSPGWSAR